MTETHNSPLLQVTMQQVLCSNSWSSRENSHTQYHLHTVSSHPVASSFPMPKSGQHDFMSTRHAKAAYNNSKIVDFQASQYCHITILHTCENHPMHAINFLSFELWKGSLKKTARMERCRKSLALNWTKRGTGGWHQRAWKLKSSSSL